jgi:hypothetical protein
MPGSPRKACSGTKGMPPKAKSKSTGKPAKKAPRNQY